MHAMLQMLTPIYLQKELGTLSEHCASKELLTSLEAAFHLCKRKINAHYQMQLNFNLR